LLLSGLILMADNYWGSMLVCRLDRQPLLTPSTPYVLPADDRLEGKSSRARLPSSRRFAPIAAIGQASIELVKPTLSSLSKPRARRV
jgi:hypothetical protein